MFKDFHFDGASSVLIRGAILQDVSLKTSKSFPNEGCVRVPISFKKAMKTSYFSRNPHFYCPESQKKNKYVDIFKRISFDICYNS